MRTVLNPNRFLSQFPPPCRAGYWGGESLLIAPREKEFEGACITVDAVGGKVRGAHTDNHCIQIRLLEHGNVHLYIQVPRHDLKLGLITLQSLFGKSLCLFGNDEVGKGFPDGCTHYWLDFSQNICPLDFIIFSLKSRAQVSVCLLTKTEENHTSQAIKARKSLDFRRNQGFWWR